MPHGGALAHRSACANPRRRAALDRAGNPNECSSGLVSTTARNRKAVAMCGSLPFGGGGRPLLRAACWVLTGARIFGWDVPRGPAPPAAAQGCCATAAALVERALAAVRLAVGSCGCLPACLPLAGSGAPTPHGGPGGRAVTPTPGATTTPCLSLGTGTAQGCCPVCPGHEAEAEAGRANPWCTPRSRRPAAHSLVRWRLPCSSPAGRPRPRRQTARLAHTLHNTGSAA